MNNVEYLRGDMASKNPREQMGEIFADGYYEWLKYFSKDKGKLAKAFAYIFKLEHFYLAVADDDEILAFTACTDGKEPSITLDKNELRKELGMISGTIAYRMLCKHLLGQSYPFALSPETGSIEFVATKEKHRGKGIAKGLITFIMAQTIYDEYVLEVASSNTSAIKLYDKLGFREFKKIPAPKKSGFDYYVYMKTI